MRWTFSEAVIENAPESYTRVRVTEGKTTEVVREGKVSYLEIGVGKWSEVNRRKFILVCRTIVQVAKKNRAKAIAVQLARSPFPQLKRLPLPELGQLIAENFEMANYEFLDFKSPDPDGPIVIEEVLICGSTPEEMRGGFAKGVVIADGVNACRTLANTPGADMTPTKLTDAIKKLSKGLPLKLKALGKKEMLKEGMGAILGVAQGSSEEPKFITLEYKGGEGAPIVLVGKGVTFDSGGLNIKTEGHMYEMHMDMSGGAAALISVILAAKLKLKKNVVALVPAVENMSAGNALRPGDILKSLSGKTIEVIDTDAEGRLILSDALTYAKRYEPSVVLDTATLTGSSLSALGMRATALFTKDDSLATTIEKVAEESGDYVWRLPLWEEYEESIKGTFADLVNLPESKAMQKGDVINAATFLYQFAKDIGAPWAHLDMAPRMTAIEADKLAKGAAGTPVRLFVRFIEAWKP